ncbi:DUF6567 family protein [Methylomicrobium sp. RS1]|uniref:DUF6567 family protein n=1 Tax=Candidatus Methylomicrobium oryzae TaxID=2802053 RepID=UPI001F2449AA|nr:DUF6567 family protein [Methylomicrobium sp. RS1]
MLIVKLQSRMAFFSSGACLTRVIARQTYSEAVTMTKLLKILFLVLPLAGCAAAIPALPALSALIPPSGGTQVLTTTTVHLSGKNYKIIKANATGSSVGFSFLGLITVTAPHYDEAISKLYRSAPVSEGKPQTIVNAVFEHSSSYFILFALPKITVRADVIEFTDNAGGALPHY